MVKTAFIFPGQGSQFVGMGQAFYEEDADCRATFEEASDILGQDMASLCINGPEEELRLTQNTQPALLIHSTIALKRLLDHDIDFVLAAGHSLGEYSALVAAESLKFADAVRLVRLRGSYMQEAVPVGVGAMAAILGMQKEAVEEVCNSQSRPNHLVQPANLNSPEQIVIAGHKEAVDAACEQANVAGAKKTVLLPVSAPFHCELMKPAEIKLQKDLEQAEFNDLKVPVVTNVDAKLVTKGSEAREALVRQVCSPVRWVETMKVLETEGIEAIVEVGTGKVLSGLMRRFNRNIACYQVSDPDSLKATVAALKS